MKNIDFEKASFKDFENIEGMDPYGWAKLWGEYVNDRGNNGQFNYRQGNLSGCGPEIELNLPGNLYRKKYPINQMIAQPNHISIFAPMKLTDKATTPPSMANKNPGTDPDPEGKENILTSYPADMP